MLSDELHDFITKRKHLIWYVNNYRALDEASVVEHALNYGDWDDVQELFRIIGIERAAEIFRKQMVTGRQKGNYRKSVRRYFNLYFDRHVKMA